MTEDQVRAALRKAVDTAGGQRAFGRAHGLSATYVGIVLGGDPPSDRICKALGIDKRMTITYHRIPRHS